MLKMASSDILILLVKGNFLSIGDMRNAKLLPFSLHCLCYAFFVIWARSFSFKLGSEEGMDMDSLSKPVNLILVKFANINCFWHCPSLHHSFRTLD